MSHQCTAGGYVVKYPDGRFVSVDEGHGYPSPVEEVTMATVWPHPSAAAKYLKIDGGDNPNGFEIHKIKSITTEPVRATTTTVTHVTYSDPG